MADIDLEELLRIPGLDFKAAGPVLGKGNIAESALRLLQLDSGQRHPGTSQLSVVRRVTYFARGALGIRMHYPHIGPQTVAYQNLVSRIVTLDKTAQREHVAQGLTMRQAVMRIVDKYRIARHHYILHADVIAPPVPVAREDETEAALADRQRFDFALREMWSVLGQLQDMTTVSGRATLATKQALAQEVKKGALLRQMLRLHENDADIQKKEHLTSRNKVKAAEKHAAFLQSQNEGLKNENDELKKENEELKNEIRLMKKDAWYTMSAIEDCKQGSVSKAANELEVIPQ
ncbi:hypothetical protein CKAH01_05367 [Colletotrichum kahawae]|uniref:Uncharacterized protein n=1 Tax=Colletotrichum kahawae TaxID=34407 RepID=A0AAD9YDR3_COLKA|nr:hypothetical protein CKAH01_05367 [Colletotrichum kahawae]